MKDIKDFRIGRASYILESKLGGKLRLGVNYKDNKFSTKVLKKGKNINRLKKQASVIAKDMLGRKAQKNLVKKLLELKI